MSINYLYIFKRSSNIERSSSSSINAEVHSLSSGKSSRVLSKGKLSFKNAHEEEESRFAQSVDLLRLAIDSKKAIDNDVSSSSNIFFQIAGKCLVVLFIMQAQT